MRALEPIQSFELAGELVTLGGGGDSWHTRDVAPGLNIDSNSLIFLESNCS